MYIFSCSRCFEQLSTLTSFSSGGIFCFDQVGITFRHESLAGSEVLQYAAYLDHFLEATEQRFLGFS